jgi:biopolymer transport protein ExbD
MSAAAVTLKRPTEEVQADPLDMTPMIDVVFQLLIFFMLTMHFKEVEGKLLSQLPRSRGPVSDHSEPLEEVRIFVCADGNLAEHSRDKGLHEKKAKDGAVCHVRVEGHDAGELRRTQTHPGSAAPNRAVYRSAAEQARALLDGAPDARRRVVLDADSEVPYEHVVGVVDALKGVRLDEIEFVANPRHLKYTR